MSPKKEELSKRLVTPIFQNYTVTDKTPRMEEISEPIYEEKTEIITTTSPATNNTFN